MRVITKVIFDTYQDTLQIRRILDEINKALTADRVEELLMSLRDEVSQQLLRLREHRDV